MGDNKRERQDDPGFAAVQEHSPVGQYRKVSLDCDVNMERSGAWCG